MEEREERGRTWVHPVVIKYRQSTRLVPAIEERSVHRMTVTVQAQAAHHVHHIVDCDSCAKSQNGANRKKFPYHPPHLPPPTTQCMMYGMVLLLLFT